MTKTLLSAAFLALSMGAGLTADAADIDFFSLLGDRQAPSGMVLSSGSTNEHFYTTTSNLEYVVNEFAWDIDAEIETNPSASPVEVTYAASDSDAPQVLFTIEPASSVFEIEAPFPAFNLPGALGIYMTEEQKSHFKAAGEYAINVPDGYFTVGSVEVGSFSIFITVTAPAVVEYPYELSPEADSTVETLSEITVTFPTASSVTYCDGGVATLTNGDGVNLTAKYPTLSGKSLVFKFAEPEGGWPAGEYTFTVLDKQICVNPGMLFDESEPGNGNVAGFSATYNVAPAVQYGDLTDVLILGTPDDLEANRKNTVTPFGQSGMGVVIFYTNKPLKVLSGSDMILYSYQEKEGSEVEVLNVVNPMDPESGLLLLSSTPSIEYGEVGGENEAYGSMYFIFAKGYDADGVIVDQSLFPTYRRNGLYTLEIPDGVFGLEDGTVLRGLTLTFAYDDSEDVYGTGYTLSPEPGTYESAAELFDYDSNGIKITFPDAKFIDSYYRVATLTLPDGQVIGNNQPRGGYNKNYYSLTFGLRNVDWNHDGEYVLEVLPQAIGLDQGFSEDWEDTGIVPNFPGLKATYVVDGGVGVWAVGMDKADSYTVMTLDGKVLLYGAASAELTKLPAGIYVVNGKKVQILK